MERSKEYKLLPLLKRPFDISLSPMYTISIHPNEYMHKIEIRIKTADGNFLFSFLGLLTCGILNAARRVRNIPTVAKDISKSQRLCKTMAENMNSFSILYADLSLIIR
jgi:hypothetical protein